MMVPWFVGQEDHVLMGAWTGGEERERFLCNKIACGAQKRRE